MPVLHKAVTVVRNISANSLMKQDCIDKICNFPLTFKQVDKSLYALLIETNFKNFYKEISLGDIIQYLQIHPNLLEVWKQYSDDKRTTGGFYYREKYIGSIDHIKFGKTFTSDTLACSEYILREISFWLQIRYE